MLDKIYRYGLGVLVVGLLVSEFTLVNKNFALKKQLFEYQNLEGLMNKSQFHSFLEKAADNAEGRVFPGGSMTDAAFAKDSSKYVVLFYLRLDGCESCIQREIDNFNSNLAFFEENGCAVRGIVENQGIVNFDRVIEQYHIKFDVLPIKGLDSLMNDYRVEDRFTLFLCERRTKKILYAFVATTENNSNDAFVPKIKRFLTEID